MEGLHVALAREHRPFADVGEVDQAGDQGGGGHTLGATGPGQPGQGHGRQGAAQAVGHQVHVRLAGGLFDRVHGGGDALDHIVVQADVGVARVRVDPGDDEDGVALVHQPFQIAGLGR